MGMAGRVKCEWRARRAATAAMADEAAKEWAWVAIHGDGMGRGGEGRGMGMGPGMGGGGMAATELPPYVWDRATKTLLFRFFDDTVEPGRRYRYRVQLVVKDVNVDQPAKYLDPKVSTRQAKEEDSLPHDRLERTKPRRGRAAAGPHLHRSNQRPHRPRARGAPHHQVGRQQ